MNRGNHDSVRLEIAGLFLAWAGTYAWLLVSGRYLFFLRPGFWLLLLSALCISSAFLTVVLFHGRTVRFVRSHAALWIRLGVLVLPLFYLLVVQDEPLGSHAFKSRLVAPTFSKAIAKGKAASGFSEDGRVTLLEILLDFRKYRGKRIVTEGMVYRDEVVPRNIFWFFVFSSSAALPTPYRPVPLWHLTKQILLRLTPGSVWKASSISRLWMAFFSHASRPQKLPPSKPRNFRISIRRCFNRHEENI